MTEKRFTYDNGNLFDNKMNTFYQIEDSEENIEILCNRLNCLVEENEQLKQQICYLIRELKTEKETSISRNERIRLDFAITVLESLKR